jgi:hypothetical protein
VPYYRGDYYQGDYYGAGDGIFSGIGRALKVVTGAAIGYITGGPKGAIAGAVGGTAMAIQSGTEMETLAAGGSESAYTPELMKRHQMALARGPLPMMIAAPQGPMLPAGGMMLARGYRWNKSTYAVRGGGTSRWGPATGQVMLIPKHTVQVKSRRMNVANPRALRRGLRRAAGFVKLARRAHVRLAAFTGRGKKKKK